MSLSHGRRAMTFKVSVHRHSTTTTTTTTIRNSKSSSLLVTMNAVVGYCNDLSRRLNSTNRRQTTARTLTSMSIDGSSNTNRCAFQQQQQHRRHQQQQQVVQQQQQVMLSSSNNSIDGSNNIFTLIPMPSLPSHLPTDAADPLLLSVVWHHEVYENGNVAGKSARPRSFDVIASILARNFALLPITIDHGGQLGPFGAAFSWNLDRRPSSALSPSLVRSSRGLSSPASLQAALLASMVSRSGFSRRAPRIWK
jgi:hypothetical protein